ncbi:MAG: radical SAM protein [Spirochaetales bacterium]|nr:radical SAM protein [Spirochaetales bacterium]
MENGKNRYVFGPVPSRRLGYSLGIDVVPFKVCSYDCIYCQLGRTTEKTLARGDFISIPEIMAELEKKLKENIPVNYITLSGSGEPTLCNSLDLLISEIRKRTNIPVAVLTNGSLLRDERVRNEIGKADLIIPSLDAGNEAIFHKVNRPCGGLSFAEMIDGIITFSDRFRDKMWMEVFLLNGITSDTSTVSEIGRIIDKINPARIQLNTVKRPPAESSALPVPAEKMHELARCFGGNVEVISEFARSTEGAYLKAAKEEIINLLERRPCTLDDIAAGLNLHKNEILKYLDELEKENVLVHHENNHVHYYSLEKKHASAYYGSNGPAG